MLDDAAHNLKNSIVAAATAFEDAAGDTDALTKLGAIASIFVGFLYVCAQSNDIAPDDFIRNLNETARAVVVDLERKGAVQ